MTSKVFGILANENSDAHKYWVAACEKQNINFIIIRMTSNYWLEDIETSRATAFLTCPSANLSHFKLMYDERLFILDKVLNHPCYPKYDEVYLHENKKMLSYWLKAKKLPHPNTFVFYDEKEALEFLKKSSLPIVGKMNIGAAGHGINIVKTKDEAYQYVTNAFTGKGVSSKTGPNIKMGMWGTRLWNVINNPKHIFDRLKHYKAVQKDSQKQFVIFQEYIHHDFEWRIVKIGESYFSYKKLKLGEKASGAKRFDYTLPSEELLNFVRTICNKFDFNSMAVDVFEDGRGGYLINEMQTIFGHVKEFLSKNENGPGRFLFTDGKWIFENGMFNTNLSYDLRLLDFLSKIGH